MKLGSKRRAISVLSRNLIILCLLSTVSLLLLLNDTVTLTTAAPLKSPSSQPTSNIVATKASYEILFTTATQGAIKTIVMGFPTGFSVGSAILIESSGIGPGTLSASGTTLTYTVGVPTTIRANTPIRLELANIIQPSNPGTFPVTITTNSVSGIIDGPTSASSFVT
jgi:hypothetical protein